MKAAALPPLDSDQPATFKSRGVAMPFTTPLLAGTRLRAAMPNGVELVVPNPSGGQGFYVLQWPGVRAFCTPTVHDTLLFQRSGELPAIDPASIRDTALIVALQGHAGRDAQAAAGAAIADDRSQRLLAHSRLINALLALPETNRPATADSTRLAAERDRHAATILHRLAPSLGRPASELAAGLTTIGDMFAPVGATEADRDARVPRLLLRLEQAHTDLAHWIGQDPANDFGGLGEAVTTAMRQAWEAGTALLHRTRSALTDTTALLKQWIKDPDGVSAWAARCDWLLDGWDKVALLSLVARTPAQRRAALLEIAPLVPVLPQQVLRWTDISIAPEAMTQPYRIISHHDTWRTGGSAFALIERNEKLLAMSALPGNARTPGASTGPQSARLPNGHSAS